MYVLQFFFQFASFGNRSKIHFIKNPLEGGFFKEKRRTAELSWFSHKLAWRHIYLTLKATLKVQLLLSNILTHTKSSGKLDTVWRRELSTATIATTKNIPISAILLLIGKKFGKYLVTYKLYTCLKSYMVFWNKLSYLTIVSEIQGNKLFLDLL